MLVRPRRFVELSCVAIVGWLASGCGDDGEGSGTTDSATGMTGTGSTTDDATGTTGTTDEPTGTTGSTGSTGTTDEPTGTTTGGGEANLCQSFPYTLALGPSIAIGEVGASVCFAAEADACYVTDNTYGDACGGPMSDFYLSAWTDMTQRSLYYADAWTFVSTSHGTQAASNVNDLPDATDITVVLQHSGGATVTFVFRFDGLELTAQSLTAA